MKKSLRRIFSAFCASVLCVGATVAFAGCSTNTPEITVTYSFNGETYEVNYTLYREAGPQTVQHFIELANNGYYDGTIIHNFTTTAMYGGGYTYDETTKNPVQKDYFNIVKDYNLTQSVFVKENGEYVGTNTLRGEFTNQGVQVAKSMKHEKGALVMYYHDKGIIGDRVADLASDGSLRDGQEYKYNCATSIFYTYTSDTSNTTLDANYCVFGKATNYDTAMEGDDGLLTAIAEYREAHSAWLNAFKDYPNRNDPYSAEAASANLPAPYNTPDADMPIVIESVKVNRY